LAVVTVVGAGGVFFETVELGDRVVEHEHRADDGELARQALPDHCRLDKLPALRDASPRAHHLADDQHDEPVGPDLNGVHRLDGHLAPVIIHPGCQQLHFVRAVRRDIRSSTEQKQVFGPGTVEITQSGRPGHQRRVISAREIVANLADPFVGHHHPSGVRRTNPVDFGDWFTAYDLEVSPPPFRF